MNEPAPADPPAAAEAALGELRRSGRSRADPVRFRYLEALAQRIPAQPEPLRELLQARFLARLAEYAAHAEPAAPVAARRATTREPASPLAQLMQVLRESRPDPAVAAGRDELASARRFREAWDAQRALEKLELAFTRRPAQAGPLNSHALVLQSLELMRTVSPQYLRQFVLHVETLQWLAADEPMARPQGQGRKAAGKGAKAAKGARTRKGQ
ncbi:MAG: DUF2894 domain-containing protein [Comamonadaceae bacterium]|nr:MAG: DUF2894 domain-containing protein [Comamonadaceae bacterium]